VLLTRSPLNHQRQALSGSVRLACVKHAASVRPEPGSNSPSKTTNQTRPMANTENTPHPPTHQHGKPKGTEQNWHQTKQPNKKGCSAKNDGAKTTTTPNPNRAQDSHCPHSLSRPLFCFQETTHKHSTHNTQALHAHQPTTDTHASQVGRRSNLSRHPQGVNFRVAVHR
jgi:hypothetical protein